LPLIPLIQNLPRNVKHFFFHIQHISGKYIFHFNRPFQKHDIGLIFLDKKLDMLPFKLLGHRRDQFLFGGRSRVRRRASGFLYYFRYGTFSQASLGFCH